MPDTKLRASAGPPFASLSPSVTIYREHLFHRFTGHPESRPLPLCWLFFPFVYAAPVPPSSPLISQVSFSASFCPVKLGQAFWTDARWKTPGFRCSRSSPLNYDGIIRGAPASPLPPSAKMIIAAAREEGSPRLMREILRLSRRGSNG